MDGAALVDGVALADGVALRARAHDVGLRLPGAELAHPFGPEADVYRVAGKMFMVVSERDGTCLVTLKTDPEEGPVLQRAYASIGPGWHMNKRHWVTVHAGPDIGPRLVEELVVDAYRRIVEALPQVRRPAAYRLGEYRAR